MSTAVATRTPSLVERFASRYSVEPAKLLDTLKNTAFKTRDGSSPSNAEMMALLVVADQYKLNPFTKEIYAFQDRGSGIVPIVGVDGWLRICNEHPQYDGVEFRYSDEMIQIDEHHKPAPEWCEAIIYRKDRTRPIVAREYLDEVYRPPFQKQGSSYVMKGPWQTHTKRFLRHKAMIQCARVAFGFAGIYDDDEADQVIANLRAGNDGTYTPEAMDPQPPKGASKLDSLAGEQPPPFEEAELDEPQEPAGFDGEPEAFDPETGEIPQEAPQKQGRKRASAGNGNGAVRAPAQDDAGALFGAEG